jgi:hypothetical protein
MVTPTQTTSVAALISRNRTEAGAQAQLSDGTVTAALDVTVRAFENATLTAQESSEVAAVGGGGAAVGAIIASNTLLSAADASIQRATITSSAGDVAVLARNTAVVTASVTSKVTSSGSAIGMVIAFNAVGVEGGNIFKMAADALLGSGFTAVETPVGANALIRDSKVTAYGSVDVIADTRDIISSDLTDLDVTAQMFDDMVPDIEGNVDADRAALAQGALQAALTTLEQGFEGELSVEALVPAQIWLVSDEVGNTWRVELTETGAVQLLRVNLIDSVVGNETSTAKNSLPSLSSAAGDPFRSAGVAGGGILSSNRIASATTAKIDRTINPTNALTSADYITAQTGDVTVSATDTANIRAYSSIAASSVISSNLNAARDFALALAAKSYSFTTQSGTQTISNGDLIYIDASLVSGANSISAGSVYRYLGTGGSKNMSALTYADLSDTSKWVRINGNADAVGQLFPSMGNLSASNSRAIGAMVVMNDVKAGATALVDHVGIQAGDDVTVSAVSKAALISRLDATVQSSGGSAWGSGTSLAVNGQIATNLVRNAASASILDSTVKRAGDIAVTADQGAVLDARVISNTEAGQNGVGVTLAFNSIGWNASNVLYQTLDVLIGDPILSSLTAIPGAGATAQILRSQVLDLADITGAAKVEAISSSRINATVSNAISSVATAMVGATSSSTGVVLVSNKTAGGTTALIDTSTVEAGGDVTVKASDIQEIHSNSSISSNSSSATDGGASALQSSINSGKPTDWASTIGAPAQPVALRFGDKVRVTDEAGLVLIYDYMGATDPTGTNLTDLSAEDYENTDYWRLEPGNALLNTGLNITESDSNSIGIILVLNDLRSTVLAKILNATVGTTNGSVVVDSDLASVVDATVDASVTSAGGSAIAGGGDNAAWGGAVATNMMLGGASSIISGSTVTAAGVDTGHVSVTSSNSAELTATTAYNAETGGGGGATLAFNSVGWNPSNLLFNAIDTFIGQSALANTNPVDASAQITNSDVTATGDILVDAENVATITADTSNATSAAGGIPQGDEAGS